MIDRSSSTRVLNGLRSRVGLARSAMVRAARNVEVGAEVRIGRGVRWRLEPGATVVLGPGCEIDDGVTIAATSGAQLLIGRGVFVGHHATLAARERVAIGDGTFLAELVSIRDHDHDPSLPPSSGHARVSPVEIGSDCWLAAKVTVTRGVAIGSRTVVGANAVVTRDLPEGCIAVGIPAKALEEHAMKASPTSTTRH